MEDIVPYATFEIIFLISFITNFLVEYTPDGETTPVTDIKMISLRYIYS